MAFPQVTTAMPAPLNYAPIVSPQLIGSLLNFFLFGTLLILVYVYRTRFSKDALGLKFFVYFNFFAMTVCTILNAVDVQYWFGAGFGDIARFADPRDSRFYTPLMGSLVGLVVHIFFACRIVAVRRAAWPLAVLVALISMAQCAGGMGSGILAYIAPGVHDQKYTALAYTWLIGRAVADALIAGIMIAFLANPTVPRAAPITTVRLMIETNLLSALVSVVGLVLFLGVPNSTYFVCPTMILPGISANTLLISLTIRPVARAADSVPSVYSARVGSARVLSVPAMSYERPEATPRMTETPARVRSSTEKKWRHEADTDADSESEYGSDMEGQV
ncbi:hypothetical protein FB451DRAFT_1365214 [Mycena latifolia]|nr:hypothetical protein FB451DRAFT_1365214 [Mycena latifolia]